VSELPKGAAVTVELASASVCDATQPGAGSFWTEIVSVPATSTCPDDPGRRIYGVRRYGAREDDIEPVERRYLRHRKLHTKAFIHISDDKTHDSQAAQTFLDKTFDYLDRAARAARLPEPPKAVARSGVWSGMVACTARSRSAGQLADESTPQLALQLLQSACARGVQRG
jgi:hypothetical protein